jgi:hypothetical protein
MCGIVAALSRHLHQESRDRFGAHQARGIVSRVQPRSFEACQVLRPRRAAKPCAIVLGWIAFPPSNRVGTRKFRFRRSMAGLCLPLSKPLPCFFARLHCFDFAVADGTHRLQRIEQPAGRTGNLVNRCRKRRLIRLGWMSKSAQLTNELQGRRTNFFVRGRGLEIEQCADVSAHSILRSVTLRDFQCLPCCCRDIRRVLDMRATPPSAARRPGATPQPSPPASGLRHGENGSTIALLDRDVGVMSRMKLKLSLS